MANVKVFNMQGAEVGEIALNDEIFGAEVHVSAMHAVVRAYMNAQRQGTTILLVEQNAQMALSIADRAYVLGTGMITMSGAAADVLADDRVRAAYLGG